MNAAQPFESVAERMAPVGSQANPEAEKITPARHMGWLKKLIASVREKARETADPMQWHIAKMFQQKAKVLGKHDAAVA